MPYITCRYITSNYYAFCLCIVYIPGLMRHYAHHVHTPLHIQDVVCQTPSATVGEPCPTCNYTVPLAPLVALKELAALAAVKVCKLKGFCYFSCASYRL